METYEEKQIRSIKSYIVRILKEAGTYEPRLGHQIELVASDILVYRKIRDTLLRCPDLTTEETSREGYPRTRVNPLLFELREQSKVVQKGLDLLTMNIKSKKGQQPAKDPLSEFMASMNEE